MFLSYHVNAPLYNFQQGYVYLVHIMLRNVQSGHKNVQSTQKSVSFKRIDTFLNYETIGLMHEGQILGNTPIKVIALFWFPFLKINIFQGFKYQ